MKVNIKNESGKRIRLSLARRGLETVFRLHSRSVAEVNLLVTNNDQLRELNREFRGLDEPTDVLTFPGPDWTGAPLGDIAVSIDFADRGAKNRKVSLSQEVAFLAIHGGLHLVGFDDVTEAARESMVEEMNRVATVAGLKPDPEWASQPHAPTG